MSDTQIYIPPNCQTLETITTLPQVRLGIQGFSGTGKTWSALTFKNPIVLNLDRGLGAHVGRKDVIEIPFYLPTFSGTVPGELKDRIMEWLYKQGSKLTKEQTLVFDGCTSLQNAYHHWFSLNQTRFLTKQGRVDDFAEYRVKKEYYGEIMALFKTLQCDVIFIAHEAEKRDKPTSPGQAGEYTGKIRPLLSGQFADELVSHFTDFFRQLAASKPSNFDAIELKSLAAWNMTREEFKAMCDSYPRNTIYYWRTESDDVFDGKASSLVNFPTFIPANFEQFNKYRRKITV